ncbi:hypothetical protein ACH5RR_029677 [Cinchona calisaya]|uniref:Uncharacterized protein n=1 Tax=Cinchona calisaya TaxID=153742 RepID=A0ABD2YSC0_9GENT
MPLRGDNFGSERMIWPRTWKLNPKRLRQILHLREEKIVNSKRYQKKKYCYCCLDYPQIYDVVRYRLHQMKRKMKDQRESKKFVKEYVLCLNTHCGKKVHCDGCRLRLVSKECFLRGVIARGN